MYGISHWPSGIQRPLFPWQQGHHLVSFSSLRYLSIRHFRVPSFTCLVRLLGSVPLLQSVALKDVHCNTPNDAVTTVNPSPGCRLLERIILDGCSDRCAVGWVFAAICLYSAGKDILGGMKMLTKMFIPLSNLFASFLGRIAQSSPR